MGGDPGANEWERSHQRGAKWEGGSFLSAYKATEPVLSQGIGRISTIRLRPPRQLLAERQPWERSRALGPHAARKPSGDPLRTAANGTVEQRPRTASKAGNRHLDGPRERAGRRVPRRREHRVDLSTHRFVTDWQFDAPPALAHAVLVDVAGYPRWWPQVRRGRQTGGSPGRLVVRSVPPHRLAFTAHEARRDEPPDSSRAPWPATWSAGRGGPSPPYGVGHLGAVRGVGPAREALTPAPRRTRSAAPPRPPRRHDARRRVRVARAPRDGRDLRSRGGAEGGRPAFGRPDPAGRGPQDECARAGGSGGDR